MSISLENLFTLRCQINKPTTRLAFSDFFPTLLLALFPSYLITLESKIDVGQGINVGPGKFVKKNKRRALNKRRTCPTFIQGMNKMCQVMLKKKTKNDSNA